MAIDAREIEEVEFTRTAFRGYKISEVDDFLDEVAEEVEKLQKENKDLQAQVAACVVKEKRIEEIEQTLRDTLITAQRAAEDVVRASREKAAAMIKDSELEGRRILEDAELQALTARQRRDSINRDVSGVKSLIRRVIGEQLRLLEESYPDNQGEKPAGQQALKPSIAAKPPTLLDVDQTQEFSVREVREQVMEEEQTDFPKIGNFSERLLQTGQNGDAEA
jgi:cell division initiation protein